MYSVIKFFLVITSVAGLIACAGFREPVEPITYTNPDAELILLDSNSFQTTEPVQAWWDTLSDPQLSRLVEHALQHNKDVNIAVANVLEARGVISELTLNRFPSVTSAASYSRIRQSDALGESASPRNDNNYDAGFDMVWELDLFGRKGAQVEAANARTRSAQANLRDIYVVVAAEVARTYIILRGAQYRLGIANRNIANQQKTVDLTVDLLDVGRATEFDVAQAKLQLQLILATIPTLEAEAAVAINRLSVLSGQVPNALQTDLSVIKPLPTTPNIIQVGDISGLLRRRPDIKRAEANLQAAIADYNVSVAEQFPVVTIIGSLGFAATSLSSFGSSALLSSIGPKVQWAAFDMGRVKARIAQNDARAIAATAAYEKTVLEALEELQTAVSHFSKEDQRRRQLQLAAISAQDVASSAEERYKIGVSTFLNVLTAEITELTTQDALAQSEITTALHLIAVYKALGGGWKHETYAAKSK